MNRNLTFFPFLVFPDQRATVENLVESLELLFGAALGVRLQNGYARVLITRVNESV